MKLKKFVLLPGYETNTFLIWDEKSKEAMLIDPSLESDRIVNFIKHNELNLKYIINTHGHGDHIGGNRYFKTQFDVDLFVHNEDAEMLPNNAKNMSAQMGFDLDSPVADVKLKGGEVLKLGDLDFKVLHTPGHTRGCICLHHKNHLISGDTLFKHGIGRTDLPGGSYEKIQHSIRTILFKLDPETIVYPGHGPFTTIGEEMLGL
jgi:glyoxylase-like metal-dependent hydrolase (beta-lactamase superfamily II)